MYSFVHLQESIVFSYAHECGKQGYGNFDNGSYHLHMYFSALYGLVSTYLGTWKYSC